MVIMTLVMNFPIHDVLRDFWRFTPGAFDLLLEDFPARTTRYQGLPQNPHTVFGIGFKSKDKDSDMSTKFEELCNQLSKEMPKKEKKGSRRLRIFKILVQERFPHLLNPVYSNESKANSISYFWETTVYEILQNLDMVRFRKEISKD